MQISTYVICLCTVCSC